MRVVPSYISIGANRSSSCSALSKNGTIAFGAGTFLALWKPDDSAGSGVSATLPHRGQVTTVKLLENDEPGPIFLSGDNTGRVYFNAAPQPSASRCYREILAHRNASISALAALQHSHLEYDNCFFTGGSDGMVKLWGVMEGKEKELQRLDLKGKLPLDLAAQTLAGADAPILVIGCTDKRIQVWTQQEGTVGRMIGTAAKGRQFKHAMSLEGHEDWIRCLSFVPYPPEPAAKYADNDLLLASGSQDNYIRLWRFARIVDTAGDEDSVDLLDDLERKLAGESSGSVQISTKAHVLAVQDGTQSLRYNVTLEALLIGHEAGLTNVNWSEPPVDGSSPLLLSTSSDNSVNIWSPSAFETESKDGIWVPQHRFGTIGARGLGFFGAIWGTEGRSVQASGWNGGWEHWVKGANGDRWEAKAGVMGHFGEVRSVVWDPTGDYLLSVGTDQTSRIHASCQASCQASSSSSSSSASSSSSSSSSSPRRWGEIARPQIHGYDMTDAAWIGPLRFVSGADEKVVRIFDAPAGFVQSLGGLGIKQPDEGKDNPANRPRGATVPPLGLSNRAIGKDVADPDVPSAHVPNATHHSVSHFLTTLPTEEELATSTLWPEVEKVYGHGYEIATVATSHDGTLFATACRATNAEHAVVRIVSTATWGLVGDPLAGHNLTITRIAFSPDDARILTCSRDRGWRIFTRCDSGHGYKPFARDEKAHVRMVLDCCWSPDGLIFATASRDKTVKLWTAEAGDETSYAATAIFKLPEGATAVDMVNKRSGESLLAVGAESGTVNIYSISSDGTGQIKADLCFEMDRSIAHAGPVNRLTWRRRDNELQLASCSDDRSVRVFDVDVGAL